MANNEPKPITQKEIRECVEDFGRQSRAHVTMGQLLDLVEKENAAQQRMQDLESDIDKLRGHLQNCVNHLHQAKRDCPRRNYDDVINQSNRVLSETL